VTQSLARIGIVLILHLFVAYADDLLRDAETARLGLLGHCAVIYLVSAFVVGIAMAKLVELPR